MSTDPVRPESTGRLERWVPGIGMVRRYQPAWLRSDLIAGVVLAAILVPQGMAYAELAGLPAVNGLYTTMACLVGYALFGPSRVLVLGPDSSLGPLILLAIVPLAVADDPAELVVLAGMLALLVAAIEIGLGLGKLGFVADLLSKEVQVGYMIGLGVTIIMGQLPKLFGFSTDGENFVQDVRAFFEGLDERNRYTLAVGLASLALLLILPRFTRRIPAVLITVILSTLAVPLFDLTDKGVTTVGSLPQGLPSLQFPSVPLSDIGVLLAAAIGITLVSLADTIATSTSFAARRGDEVDASKEMIGIGAANAFAGLFQGFPVSTSGSRTAVAEQGGAKSQVTGLVGAALVAIMLLFLPDLLANLPNSALAAIVIAAGLSLIDIATVAKFLRVRMSAFVLTMAATLGVVFFGVLEGILIAVALSILGFFRRNWWPTGRSSAGSPRLTTPGTASTSIPTPSRPPASSCSVGRHRCSSPTPTCSARRSAAWSTARTPAGSSSSARPSPTSTSPQPTCSSDSTASSTSVASTWYSLSCAAACTISWTATGSSKRSTRSTSTTHWTRRSRQSPPGVASADHQAR